MASHFTVLAGREGRFVYILQRGCLRSAGLVADTGASGAHEATHFSEQSPVAAQPSGWTGDAGPPQSSPGGHSALLPVTRSFLKLIVFHFLTITLLPHPKPNTEMCPLFTQLQGMQ